MAIVSPHVRFYLDLTAVDGELTGCVFFKNIFFFQLFCPHQNRLDRWKIRKRVYILNETP